MFAYKYWENFCKELKENDICSVTAESVLFNKEKDFLILKHDVEDNPKKALEMAKIEAKYSHKSTYYVQGFLMSDENLHIFKEIQQLGHEVSYHHDVMDANCGNLQKAIQTFSENKGNFEKYGFKINTVCQHGNPIANRDGYTSNRDFFRSEEVQSIFPEIAEIMVDFGEKIGAEYKYISDAGYGWKIIFDPINNDIVKSNDKDIKLKSLESVIDVIKENKSIIVSTHPHRWCKSNVTACYRYVRFKVLRIGAKITYKIPGIKKVMEKFYFLTKKI